MGLGAVPLASELDAVLTPDTEDSDAELALPVEAPADDPIMETEIAQEVDGKAPPSLYSGPHAGSSYGKCGHSPLLCPFHSARAWTIPFHVLARCPFGTTHSGTFPCPLDSILCAIVDIAAPLLCPFYLGRT